MIFFQTTNAIISLGAILIATTAIFAWRWISLKKKALQALAEAPSVVVVGFKESKKGSYIEEMFGSKALTHSVRDDLNVAVRPSGNLQLIETSLADGIDARAVAKRLDGINVKEIMYVFDLSSDSNIQSQMKKFAKFTRSFKDVPVIPVVGRYDGDGKVAELRKKLGEFGYPSKVYEFKAGPISPSLSDKKEELSDIMALLRTIDIPSKVESSSKLES